MFTHECILNKNTPEIREKLESLGIRYKYASNVGTDSVIKCGNGSYNTYQSKYYQSLKDVFTKATYCGTNEKLFLAIAALRDDSDKFQWFVSEANQFTGMCMTAVDFGEFRFCSIDKFPPSGLFHKATVDELIKHFSK